MGLTHNALNLDIDAARRLLGVILVIGVIAAQEYLMLRLTKHLRSQLLAHAQARDHLARHLGRALQIVARARRDVVAHELLGNAAAQEHGKLVEHLVLGLEEVILLRKLQRVTQRLAAADDRDLVNRIGVLQDVAHQSVAALVVGNRGALGLGHHATLALRSGNHALHRFLDLVHRDHGTMAAGSQQRRLVEQICQIGAGKANGHLGEFLKLHVLVHRLVLGMHAQDLLAALHIRTVDRNLTVKTTGTQQRRIQNVGTVGGGDQDDRLALLKTVHLDKQLVERLLALVVTAAQTSSTLTSHGIDLIDEDDRRGLGLGLLKEVTHTAGADAHEHLDKVGARDAKERHARLTGNGLGQQRFTSARRAHQQHATRDLGTQLAIAIRIAQKVTDLLELLDCLVHAGNVFELDLGARGLVGLSVGLAKLHVPVIGAHHLAHKVEHNGDQGDRRKHAHRQVAPKIGVIGVDDVLGVGVLRHELGKRIGADIGRREALELARIALVLLRLPVMTRHTSVLNRIGQIFDAILLDGTDHLARRELNGIAGAGKAGAHVKEGVAQKRASQNKIQPARTRGFLASGHPRDLWVPGSLGIVVVTVVGHLTNKPPVSKCPDTEGCDSARHSRGRSPPQRHRGNGFQHTWA